MENTTNGQPTVIRTGRGLTVAGTRITLYAIMDFIKEDYPPKLIRYKFNLTEQQMADVLAYIEEHREEVEAEYRQVVEEGEERRREWEKQRREILANIPSDRPMSPKEALIRAKLAEAKARLGME
ncbi:MAG: DUF433 domain-containing protein [Acidobacteria bacterium]|nr:DUF433 domain-containing protein [Acidobacteriota bacterium]